MSWLTKEEISILYELARGETTMPHPDIVAMLLSDECRNHTLGILIAYQLDVDEGKAMLHSVVMRRGMSAICV